MKSGDQQRSIFVDSSLSWSFHREKQMKLRWQGYAVVVPLGLLCFLLSPLTAISIRGQEQTAKPIEIAHEEDADEDEEEEQIHSPDGDPPKLERMAVSISGQALNGNGIPVNGATV